ncbi:MAG: GNAT family N-acetyltransferase [Candidatus Aenigmatarchaeota archaeon]
MNFVFKKLTKKDSNNIEKFLFLLENDYVPPLSESEISKEIRGIKKGKEISFGVLLKENIIGFVSWRLYENNYGYISIIGVHPDYRKKGIGTKLAKMCIDDMKKLELRGIYSTTWPENRAMIKLSENIGLVPLKEYIDEKFGESGRKTILLRKFF